jgi:hypothetical protein
MNNTSLTFRFFLILAFLLASTGCTRSPHLSQSAQPSEPISPAVNAEQAKALANAAGQEKPESLQGKCPDDRTIRESEHNRANCYHLQPGATTTITKKKRATCKAAKTTLKKGQKATAKKTTATKTTVVRTTGRCQPQSLIYARCRTGITTCRLGDTSPVQWFACARKNGDTSSIPTAGSVMVLDSNSGRGMPTGHPMYVEAVKENKDGTWTLRISHTNYDRKCHLDQDATVLYHPKHLTANFQSGPWATWANSLKSLGFILR